MDDPDDPASAQYQDEDTDDDDYDSEDDSMVIRLARRAEKSQWTVGRCFDEVSESSMPYMAFRGDEGVVAARQMLTRAYQYIGDIDTPWEQAVWTENVLQTAAAAVTALSGEKNAGALFTTFLWLGWLIRAKHGDLRAVRQARRIREQLRQIVSEDYWQQMEIDVDDFDQLLVRLEDAQPTPDDLGAPSSGILQPFDPIALRTLKNLAQHAAKKAGASGMDQAETGGMLEEDKEDPEVTEDDQDGEEAEDEATRDGVDFALTQAVRVRITERRQTGPLGIALTDFLLLGSQQMAAEQIENEPLLQDWAAVILLGKDLDEVIGDNDWQEILLYCRRLSHLARELAARGCLPSPKPPVTPWPVLVRSALAFEEPAGRVAGIDAVHAGDSTPLAPSLEEFLLEVFARPDTRTFVRLTGMVTAGLWREQRVEEALTVELLDQHQRTRAAYPYDPDLAEYFPWVPASESMDHVMEAIALSSELQDSACLAYYHHLLGSDLALAGHTDEALIPLREAVTLYCTMLPAELRRTLPQLATTARDAIEIASDLGDASEVLRTSSDILRAVDALLANDPSLKDSVASAMSGIEEMLRAKGQHQAASQFHSSLA